MEAEGNFHYIKTIKELRKFVGKPLMFINRNGYAWAMIFKNLYKPSSTLCKFPCNYYIVGTHMAYMSNNIYAFKVVKPCVYYSQPLTDLCQSSAQEEIRTLTYEEMKEYKKCIHKAMLDGTEKMKTQYKAKANMYYKYDKDAKKLI